MFVLVEHISYIDIITESIKAILVLALLVILWRCGKRYPDLAGGSWNLILIGFVCIDIGMFLDVSDEIISYRNTSDLVDLVENTIEEGCSMLGFVLITVGFSKWFQFVGKFLGME